MLSFFSSPSDVCHDSKSHQKDIPQLNYYIKKSFSFMDDQVYLPSKMLLNLLDTYLSFNQLNKLYYHRIIGQEVLAQTMKLALETMPPDEGAQHVFRLLNESNNEIKSNDDLIWLFSAICSIYPTLYSKITNQ